MNRSKKLLATTLATTMVLGTATTALAADPVIGDVGFEINKSATPNYHSVVLPTLSADTYKFTVDPTGLLNNYVGNSYVSGKTVYFQAQQSPATLASTTSGATLYYDVKTASADSNATELAALAKACSTSDGNAVTFTDPAISYYLWVPDTTSSDYGAGKYEKITSTNFSTYFKTTVTGDNAPYTIVVDFVDNYNASVASANDGKIYTDTKTALGSTDVSQFITLSNNALSATSGLYTSDDGVAYTPVTDISKLDYTPAVAHYTNTTEKATIKNGEAVAKNIEARVTLKNLAGLVIDEDGTFASEDKDARIALKLTDGSTDQYLTVNDDGTASAVLTTELAAVSYLVTPTNTYVSGINANTGGHDYAQYVPATAPSIPEWYFQIEASANGGSDDEIKEAWIEYAESLEEVGAQKPQIEVVYTISDVDDNVDDNVDVPTYPTIATDDTATLDWDDTTQNLVFAVDLDSYGVDEIADIGVKFNGTTTHCINGVWNPDSTALASYVTYDAGVVTIDKTYYEKFSSKDGYNKIYVALSEDKSKKVIITITTN